MLHFLTNQVIGVVTLCIASFYILLNVSIKKYKSSDLLRLLISVPAFLFGILRANNVYNAWTKGVTVLNIEKVGTIDTWIVMLGLTVTAYVSLLSLLKIFGLDVEIMLSANIKMEEGRNKQDNIANEEH